MIRPRAVAALAFAVAASVGSGIANAAVDERASARQVLVRYFDAIRDDDKATACRMYRVPTCGGPDAFGLAAYELEPLQRITWPGLGDFATRVVLYAPRRANGTRAVATAMVAITCKPGCRITAFYGE